MNPRDLMQVYANDMARIACIAFVVGWVIGALVTFVLMKVIA